ncbi:MAG: hypothetical protein ACO26G_05265, partial [Rickettsiales bacterium]
NSFGMAMASKLSKELNFIDQFQYEEIISHLKKSGFELNLKNFELKYKLNNLVKNLYKDKKTQNNQLNFILLKNIGNGHIYNKIDKKFITNFFKNYLDS